MPAEYCHVAKRMLSIDQGCWIMTSRESFLNGIIQLFASECCSVHCTILNKLKGINYPFEIPPNTQHDLGETVLFGDDLYRSRFGGRA